MTLVYSFMNKISVHKNDYVYRNIFSCGKMPMCCTMRCILYVENMILLSELHCNYICLFYQMWFSSVQEQNMVNRKVVKTIDVKKKIISPICSKITKSTLSVTPLRSALVVPEILFSIRSGTKPELADLFGFFVIALSWLYGFQLKYS